MALSGYYDFVGSVTIGIWAKRTAGWQKVATEFVEVDGGTYTSPALRTFNWFRDNVTYQLGTNVLAVGLTVDGVNANSAAITTFNKLAWQAQGTASSIRSATPNGQKSTVTVKP